MNNELWKKSVDGLFHATLHYTTLHFTTLHYTTPHYTIPDTESEPMTGMSLAADHSFEEVSGAIKEVYLVGILTWRGFK